MWTWKVIWQAATIFAGETAQEEQPAAFGSPLDGNGNLRWHEIGGKKLAVCDGWNKACSK